MTRMHRRLLPRRLLTALTVAATSLVWSTAQAGGQVYDTADEVMPLQPGKKIPSVRVESVRGEPVELAERVREQGALLVFYRGGW